MRHMIGYVIRIHEWAIESIEMFSESAYPLFKPTRE